MSGLLAGHLTILAVTLTAIPAVYLIRTAVLGEDEGFDLDERQRNELLLAAAQSVFLVMLLSADGGDCRKRCRVIRVVPGAIGP